MAIELLRILGGGKFYASRQNVDHVPRLSTELTGGADTCWPVCDEGRTNAPFVTVVLIEPPGRVAGVGPGGAVAEEAARLAHLSQFAAAMKHIRRLRRSHVNAHARLRVLHRRKIETKRLPFGARAVVAEKKDQRVVEVLMPAKVGEQAPDISVHPGDHSRIDGHPLGQIGAALGWKAVPSWIVAVGGF